MLATAPGTKGHRRRARYQNTGTGTSVAGAVLDGDLGPDKAVSPWLARPRFDGTTLRPPKAGSIIRPLLRAPCPRPRKGRPGVEDSRIAVRGGNSRFPRIFGRGGCGRVPDRDRLIQSLSQAYRQRVTG